MAAVRQLLRRYTKRFTRGADERGGGLVDVDFPSAVGVIAGDMRYILQQKRRSERDWSPVYGATVPLTMRDGRWHLLNRRFRYQEFDWDFRLVIYRG